MEQGGAISDRPAHEGPMGSGSLSLIGSSWASADGFRRSLRRSPAASAPAKQFSASRRNRAHE
jgi:hypothetical protein